MAGLCWKSRVGLSTDMSKRFGYFTEQEWMSYRAGDYLYDHKNCGTFCEDASSFLMNLARLVLEEQDSPSKHW